VSPVHQRQMLAGMLQDLIQHLRRSRTTGPLQMMRIVLATLVCDQRTERAPVLTGCCLVAICNAWLSRDIERPHVCMAMPGIHVLPTLM
jgi:hypothetical protein